MATPFPSFSNDCVEYPSNLGKSLSKSRLANHDYFLGLCAYCYTSREKGNDRDPPLNRCSGCQLLAYCSKECQKNDWSLHKPICKEFALKNGRNILSEGHKLKKEARNKYIDELKARALQILIAENSDQEVIDSYTRFAHGLFDWARVCNICKEARVDKLTDCVCHSLSYCSEGHRKADKGHKEDCYDLLVYARTVSYFKKNANRLNLPMNGQVDKEYERLTRMEFHVSSMKDEWLDAKLAILSERLSFPLTILYAMQESGLGTNKTPVESVSSLNIHVVSPMPMLDSSMWENLVHRLPQLNELNLSFIGCNLVPSNRLNIDITHKLERCLDCKSRNRLITYNMHPQYYHMYFSSMEYSEPDVIAMFNNKETSQKEDNVHAVTSYRNMTYDEDTLIILTGTDEKEIQESIRVINEARPVNVILPARWNPFRGFSSVRGTQFKPIINSKEYIACVRRK